MMVPADPAVDAAGEFLEVLRGMGEPSPGEILTVWEEFHRLRFPELYAKQVQDYASRGEDWRAVALARVFSSLRGRLAAMEEAREGIADRWGEVLARARKALELDLDGVGVVQVGIGCGAGWATTYGGRPAVLLGLEAITELGWQTPDRLAGLIAHELGHLAHAAGRGDPLEALEEDPFGLLYVEGFAQRLEGEILGRESWHQAPGEGWLRWCRAQLPELACVDRERALKGEGVSDFFGSWMSYRGVSFSGYFLGGTVISALERGRPLRELARLPLTEVRASVDQLLRELAAASPTL